MFFDLTDKIQHDYVVCILLVQVKAKEGRKINFISCIWYQNHMLDLK